MISELFWLTEVQVGRMSPFFPKSRGKPRADDRRILSGIIYIQRNGLMWKDAPGDYGRHDTLRPLKAVEPDGRLSQDHD